MRHFLFSLFLTLLALPVHAAVSLKDTPTGTYVVDPGHSALMFRYSHLGLSSTYARIKTFNATLKFDAEKPENSKIDVTLSPGSVDSGYEAMDAKFISDELFDTAKYPTARFTSTKVEKLSGSTGKVHGELTLRGITKPVVLDVTLNGALVNSYSKQPTLGFSGKATVKRSDFGMGAGVPMVSDEVDIIIEAEFGKTNAQ